VKPIRIPLLPLFCLALLLAVQSCKRTTVQLTTTQQADTDDDRLREYLTRKGITGYTRTPTGVYVVIDSAKPDKPFIRSGNFVYVRYRGYFPNGERVAFDSNTVDSTESLFRVEIGRAGTVINGWQEGLKLMRPGEKGRLFIPSGQAYGGRGSGTIPANQNLIFDIAVKSVQ